MSLASQVRLNYLCLKTTPGLFFKLKFKKTEVNIGSRDLIYKIYFKKIFFIKILKIKLNRFFFIGWIHVFIDRNKIYFVESQHCSRIDNPARRNKEIFHIQINKIKTK